MLLNDDVTSHYVGLSRFSRKPILDDWRHLLPLYTFFALLEYELFSHIRFY